MSICQRCGACCASLRIDFHPAELAGGAYAWGDGVPVAMAVPVTSAIVRLRGTDAVPPRCVALVGEIGVAVACGIYEARPSPCREFDVEHPVCNRVRCQCGLPPLG